MRRLRVAGLAWLGVVRLRAPSWLPPFCVMPTHYIYRSTLWPSSVALTAAVEAGVRRVSWRLSIVLIVKVLQNAFFCLPKDGLLRCRRSPFASQKLAFGNFSRGFRRRNALAGSFRTVSAVSVPVRSACPAGNIPPSFLVTGRCFSCCPAEVSRPCSVYRLAVFKYIK